MILRLKIWWAILLVSLSQSLFNVGIVGLLFWVVLNRGSPPDPDEPLSSRVGRAAIEGKRWGLWAEKHIDSIFGVQHCRESAIKHTGEL